jgi:acetoin utilization deacetylase AcuC-like enzyme
MKFYYSEQQATHAPAHFLLRGSVASSPERPERADLLREAIVSANGRVTDPGVWDTDALRQRLRQIHTDRYLAFLETIVEEWQQLPGAAESVTPNVHPTGHASHYPKHPVGRAGWHMHDMAAPLTKGSFSGIMASAASAQAAALAVVAGETSSYALCRPPGHHAGPDRAGGFCFLNNSALAATVLRERFDQVAIIDVDVHHGNGTQDIFWRRDDVWTGSVHAEPDDYYPFFWGAASEIGKGAGEGFNRNHPLPVGADGEAFMAALDSLLDEMSDTFTPDAVVVALGLDAHEDDPLAGMTLKTSDFTRMGHRLGRMGLPTVLIQEGGYPTDSLAGNLRAFLQGYMTG